jgi:hypothetical protein
MYAGKRNSPIVGNDVREFQYTERLSKEFMNILSYKLYIFIRRYSSCQATAQQSDGVEGTCRHGFVHSKTPTKDRCQSDRNCESY